MEIGPLLNEWAADNFSDEKLQELKQQHPDVDWLVLAGRVMQESQFLEPKFDREVDSLWDKIERKIDGVEEPEEEDLPAEQEAEVRPFRRSRRQVFGLVAFFLLLAIIIVSLNIGGEVKIVEETTGIAETDTIELPGGSKVFLAGSSSLSWGPEEWDENRAVNLKGKAFFEVTPGAQFSVQTGRGIVSVLGTSFNVESRGALLKVACKTGKVRVKLANINEELGPGDQVNIDAEGRYQRKTVAPEQIGSWQEGMFYYEGETMDQVFAELERQFEIEVEVEDPAINSLICNGFFTNDDISRALNQLCIPLGLVYDLDEANKKVIIRE